MDFRYKRPIRIIALLTLCLFCWSFGGIFDIVAFAATDSKQTPSNKQLSSQSSSQLQPKIPKPEEKFQKTIEDITQIVNDTSTDTDTKKNKLKTKRSEIEGLDTAIKRQFSDTERFLKEKGLPPEILERHYKFVKHYDDNLKELNDNLAAIDKSKTKTEADAAISRARAHLEKVRPPKKHIPLDPNKLPHRTAEPVWKEPRTSPEEFKTEDRAQNTDNRLKPILVASNGSLNGLISEQQVITSPILLALADPPTDADIAQTIEVQFTPAIRAKAEELGKTPVRIYNWVRNNIEFVPTYGSIQGADMCLQTKLCNDFDTASLLIALLRVSGIHAKYVYGTIELPIEKVKNWVGGFTDSMEALRLLASAKIPTKGMTVGGEIKYARIEHIYVEAWIDMIPSQGAIHKKGDTWVPLDASFKQYNYTQGIDIKSAVPFDAQSFIDQIQSTATINETEGYVTNVNSLYIQQQMTDYQTRVQNYISQNYPNATVGDVLGKKETIKQEFSVLLGTLPYKMIVKGAIYAIIPDSMRHKLNFNVVKDMYDEIIGTPINITKSLPELAGKKITLSYSPATSADEAVINSYLPKPHADGTPIDPNEFPSSLPAYLINLKPELRIDGIVVSTGTSVGMGNTETFNMTFTAPNESSDAITNDIQAGEYLAIALDLGRIANQQMQELKTKLESTKTKFETLDLSEVTKETVLGDLLYLTAISYLKELDMINFINASIMKNMAIRLPSEAKFSIEMSVRSFFGIPMSISYSSFAMDVDRTISLVKALGGEKDDVKTFLQLSGFASSMLEYTVPELIFNKPDILAQGMSAVRALKIANDQGIPIYKINQSNITTVLPQLQVDADVKADIQNAVNAGKEVTVSKTNVTFNGWIGCGYIIVDPVTGEGAYMIGEGLGGGRLMIASGVLLVILGVVGLIGSAGIATPVAIALITLGINTIATGLCWYFMDDSWLFKGTVPVSLVALLLGMLAIPLSLGVVIGAAASLVFKDIIKTLVGVGALTVKDWLDKFLKDACEYPLP